MVKTTEFGDRALVHDLALNRALLLQRQMRTRSVVKVEVRGQYPLQVTSVQDNAVIRHSRRTDPIKRST